MRTSIQRFYLILAFVYLAVSALPAFAAGEATVVVWQSKRDGNWEIYAAAPDGAQPRRLTSDPADDELPSVSPDGRRVAFSSDRSGNYGIYMMDAEGTNIKAVTAAVDQALGPAWSPDGTMLAFSGSHTNNWDIYIVQTNGTGLRRLMTSPDFDAGPTWSPDGTRIAFHRCDSSGNYDIYVINILTLQETRLTDNPGMDGQPAWSPDGRWIAFFSEQDLSGSRIGHIFTMGTDGGIPVDVTPGSGFYANPAWSPDGREIAAELYLDPMINIADICRIQLDGSGVLNVSTNTADDRAPSWGPLFVPAADLKVQAVQVRLQYKHEGWAVPAAPSATGAEYWIEGVLLSTRYMRQSFDRIQDSATLYGVAAANYELQLAYGPNLMAATRSDVGGAAGSGGQVLLGRRVPVEVIRNQTTVVTVDLSRDLGVIEGGVTLNGTAPGPGLALCVEARASTSTAERGEIFTWCMDLPATGQFRLLLPSGRGRGVICSSELVSNGRLVGSTTTAAGIAAGLLMQEFTFDVQAGKTTILPTIAFVTQRVEVRLQVQARGMGGPGGAERDGCGVLDRRGAVVNALHASVF